MGGGRAPLYSILARTLAWRMRGSAQFSQNKFTVSEKNVWQKSKGFLTHGKQKTKKTLGLEVERPLEPQAAMAGELRSMHLERCTEDRLPPPSAVIPHGVRIPSLR